MSFGREAMKKTLKQLKGASTLQFKVFEDIVKDVNTQLERMDKDLTAVADKPIRKKIDSLGDTTKGLGKIIRDLTSGTFSLLVALTSYISALENYSLEFDKTWDDLTKRTEKVMKQVGDKTEQLKKKDLRYIG